MKIVSLIIQLFAIFAFLTIGSLMIIVSLQVLSMEDALLKVQDLYENPWQSLKMGATGLLFIFAGLIFSKMMVRSLRPSDDIVLYGKWGPVSISIQAIDELVRRVLRKFEVVRALKIKTDADGNRLEVTANLTVASGWNVDELIHTIQKELCDRIQKVLGGGIELVVAVHIAKIIEESATGEVGVSGR